MALHLEVVTPEGTKLSEDVSEITAPGVMGELGILENHIPVLTVLDVGKLTLKTTEATTVLAINGGYLEVDNNRLIVITETAESKADIDVERARAAIQKAEEAMATLETGSGEYQSRMRKVRRNQNRIEVASA